MSPATQRFFSSTLVIIGLLSVAHILAAETSATYSLVADNIRAENITPYGVQVKWFTNLPADSKVFFRTASGGMQESLWRCDTGGFVTEHCVNLSDLAPETTYWYKIRAVTSVGQEVVRDGFLFTTTGTTTQNPSPPESNSSTTPVASAAVDTTPPTPPTDVRVQIISKNAITLSWNAAIDTGDIAGYKVYRSGASMAHAGTNLSFADTGLIPNTDYRYKIAAYDTAGNFAWSDEITAQTLPEEQTAETTTSTKETSEISTAATTTPYSRPIETIAISHLRVENNKGRGAQVAWTTNVPSDSKVMFGTTPVNMSRESTWRCDTGEFVTEHCVNLINLATETAYYYRALSSTEKNSAAHANGQFTTTAVQESAIANPASTTVITASSDTTASPDQKPRAYLGIQTEQGKLSGGEIVYGVASIKIYVEKAIAVALYLKASGGAEPKHLGMAERSSDNSAVWKLVFDSQSVPNGDYRIFSRITNADGDYGGDGVAIRVNNTAGTNQMPTIPPQTTPPTETAPEKPVARELPHITREILQKTEQPKEEARIQKEGDSAENISEEKKLATTKVEVAPNVLVEQEMLSLLPPLVERRVYLDPQGPHVADFDGDGITNYDEENIFKTDPVKTDTDGDGASDKEELLAGASPVTKEVAPIVYENPKDAVPSAEDTSAARKIFTVESVEAKTIIEMPGGEKKATEIAFSGRGLPNSFVTLYIFSTPIIVTVQTDGDGKWNYVLDKELQDGTHEVYVAMTDATGDIVVKSDPIPFVKSAQAVTLTANVELAQDISQGETSFWNTQIITLLVLGLIALFGVALITLGLVRKSDVPNDDPSPPSHLA